MIRNQILSLVNTFRQPLTRSYSVFPKYFIDPIYQESEQQKLAESGELKDYAYLPVRPATTDKTASVWHDPLVQKFTNHMVKDGNKLRARGLVESTFEAIKKIQLEKYHNTVDPEEKEKIVLNPWAIFHAAIHNIRPMLETVPIKRGAGTYQVPVPVREKRQVFLAMKWLLESVVDKSNREVRYHVKMSKELLDAANNTGRNVKRKHDLHKLCEANRAYAHYRWG
jgi:small subunit ribosomal protein S7